MMPLTEPEKFFEKKLFFEKMKIMASSRGGGLFGETLDEVH